MRWQDEHNKVLEMLKGTIEDRRSLYNWLISKVTSGETLNLGYQKLLKQLHDELFTKVNSQ